MLRTRREWQRFSNTKVRAAAIDVFRWLGPLSIAAVGALGVVRDSCQSYATSSWLRLHLGFGMLLWLYVISQFALPTKLHQFRRAIGGIELTRTLSRGVYLLLYELAGVKECCYLLSQYWLPEMLGFAPSAGMSLLRWPKP
jgi:cytochrome b561